MRGAPCCSKFIKTVECYLCHLSENDLALPLETVCVKILQWDVAMQLDSIASTCACLCNNLPKNMHVTGRCSPSTSKLTAGVSVGVIKPHIGLDDAFEFTWILHEEPAFCLPELAGCILQVANDWTERGGARAESGQRGGVISERFWSSVVCWKKGEARQKQREMKREMEEKAKEEKSMVYERRH